MNKIHALLLSSTAAAVWALATAPAQAQNPQCPTRPPGDSTNACASTAFVQQAIGGGGGATPVIDVTQHGVVCDATGSVDNRAAFQAIAALINANHTAIVNFPHGHLNCGVWPAGSTIPASDVLFNLNSTVIGLTVNYNGACITTNSTDTEWNAGGAHGAYVWLFNRASANRVTFNEPCYLQTGTSNPTSLFGGQHIVVIGDGTGLYIKNGHQIGGTIGLAISRDEGTTDQFNGVVIDGFNFNGVYVPLSFQRNGHNVTAVSVYSQNHERFYFPYDVHSHYIRARIKVAGNILPEGGLLKLYCFTGDTVPQNTLQSIDLGLDLENGGPVTFYSIVNFAFQQATTGDTCLNKGTMRDIKVKVTGDLPQTSGYANVWAAGKLKFDNSVDNIVRGYTLDNIEISGALTNINSNAVSGSVVDLFNPSNGSFAGENLSNIIVDKLQLRSSSTAPGNNDIVIDGSSVNGLRLDSVRMTNNISVSNASLAQTAWNQIYAPSFTINGAAAPPKAFPECADVTGNHLNYTSAGGITCGNTSSGGGGGGVTSVAQTFTGGLISVAGSPITGAGTLALSVAGTSGGIPYFSGAATWASSGVLGAGLPVVGGGAGVAPSSGTRSGNTTQFVTTTGAQTSGNCVTIDASGNHIAAGAACGTSSGGITSVTATAPVVAAPNPIVATGTLSCPTCVTSAAALTANSLVVGAGGQASAALASPGTTTTVLHGNAAGLPSFGAVSLTADVSGILPAPGGGTGQGTYAVGDLLYASTTTALSRLASVAAGATLTTGGVGAAPVWSPVGQLSATATNDSAAAGKVGQYISSSVTQGAAVPLTTGTNADITSISLTAGDWDVWGVISTSPAGATLTSVVAGWTSASSATFPTPPNNGGYNANNVGSGGGLTITLAVPTQRFSLNATTTIFLSTISNFSGGTMGAYGFIGARRVR